LFPAENGSTTVRIFNINTRTVIHSEVQTPNGKVSYKGEQKIDGVDGSAAPIYLHFLNAEGAKTGRFFPSGNMIENINGVSVTLIDYSVPMVLFEGKSVGLTGVETAKDIDDNQELLAIIENIRLEAGLRMGLGDVSKKVIPKVGILSQSNKGLLKSYYLMPHKCHKSHAITGAMCIASACYEENTVVSNMINEVLTKGHRVIIEHPTGVIDLNVKLHDSNKIESIAVIRTARRLFEGSVLVQ